MNATAQLSLETIDPRFRTLAEATDQHFDEHGSKRGDYSNQAAELHIKAAEAAESAEAARAMLDQLWDCLILRDKHAN